MCAFFFLPLFMFIVLITKTQFITFSSLYGFAFMVLQKTYPKIQILAFME